MILAYFTRNTKQINYKFNSADGLSVRLFLFILRVSWNSRNEILCSLMLNEVEYMITAAY
jgi:hypothetical protein